jgi:hypothetical protein
MADISDRLELPTVADGPPAAKAVDVRMPDGRVQKVRAKLKTMIDRMVWDGEPWEVAAAAAKLQTRSARKALEKPHVVRYLREQRSLFRSALSARNEHVAADIRDNSANAMARVASLRYLDGLPVGDNGAGLSRVTPGVVVHVNVNREPALVDDRVIEVNPVGDT